MAEIRPFQGVRYNQTLLNDISEVICPPYDIITLQMEQELYRRSKYNFIRLENARQLSDDIASNDKYTRSAATLEQWLKQGVLEVDEASAIYLHDHRFTYQGMEYKRRGMIACVRLEEWDSKVIRPHEGTLAEPRGDRLSLLWALGANTSPILALFEDEGQQVASLLAAQARSKPLISTSRINGESHDVWAISEPEVVTQICGSLAHQPLYIADGHHRYESALSYQRERRAYLSSVSTGEAFDFVMMTLVDFADPGLIILPPHRLVRGISKSALGELMAKLRSFFEIEELVLSMPDVWQRVNSLLTPVELGETNRVSLVLLGLAAERLLVLRLRDLDATGQMMPYFHSELYKSLGVSIIDHIVLEKLLGLSGGEGEVAITYSYDKTDAVNRVLDQEYQLAFLLSPVKAEVVKAIADAGDRMPRKSTYFYPKLPTGLVFRLLV